MAHEKLEKMNLVAEKTLLLCERKGIEGISISQVANLSGVSRPWIYKYIGSTPESLLNFAMTLFGNTFALLENRPNPTDEGEWIESARLGFEHIVNVCEKNRWVLSLYFRYKGNAGPIGDQIRGIEAKFVAESSKEMQKALRIDKKLAQEHSHYLMILRMALIHDLFSTKSAQNNKNQLTDYFCGLCKKVVGI